MSNFIRGMLLLLTYCTISFGQIKAITENGREVLLRPDGTWEYVTSEISSRDEFDFRKAKWGNTKAIVKSSETATPIPNIEDPSILGYTTTVGGLNAIVVYAFVKDKLWKANYIYDEEHSNKNIYLNDYTKIKDILIEKYGEPKKDEVKWLNSLYADDSEHYGLAVSMGHVTLFSIWELPDTQITLMLSGDNYKIKHQVEYLSLKLKKLAEEQHKKSRKTDF